MAHKSTGKFVTAGRQPESGDRPAKTKSQELWSLAESMLSAEDKEDIDFPHTEDNISILDQVLKVTKEKQKECEKKQWTYTRKNGKTIVLRNVFDSILEWTKSFEQVVDFVVSLDVTGHAALPWAGVKFFIEMASKDSERYGAILEGTELVTRVISFYSIFERVYLRESVSEATEQLSRRLVETYSKVLLYLSKAKKYYTQHTITRAFRSAFRVDESELDEIMKAISDGGAEIDRLARVIDGERGEGMAKGIESLTAEQRRMRKFLTDFEKPMKLMATQLAEIQDMNKKFYAEWQEKTKKEELAAKEEELPTIEKHLSPQAVTDYDKLRREFIEGTGTWLLKENALTDWIDSKIPVLSLLGGAGCGKSYLSTLAIKHTLEKAAEKGLRNITVGYYYFHDNDNRTQSMLNALCAIVYQIAKEDEIYRMHAANTCKRSPGVATATYRTIWYDFIAPEYGSTSDRRLYLIFDGVDEAGKQDLLDLITLVEESINDSLRVQVLLVGRPSVKESISRTLDDSSFNVIEVSSEKNSNDITKFITVRYDKYIKDPTVRKIRGLKQKVISKLSERANGMFLWVDLTYQELQGMRLKQLSMALKSLPDSNLTALYDRIFARIERDAGNEKTLAQIKELLCWVAYSTQPLSVFHLNEIIQFAVGDSRFEVKNIIENNCASLLTLVMTGEALFDERSKSEVLADEAAESSINEDEFDEDEISDGELDENEEIERQNRCDRETFVHLRHASLGDYLKKPDLKATGITLNARDAPVHLVLTTLRVISQGSSTPELLWLYAMENWLRQLQDLDEKSVLEEDTKRIAEFIVDIFFSEPLRKHIAKFHSTAYDYPLLGDCFWFGPNTDLQSGNRAVVQRWLRKADSMEHTKLTPEASKCVRKVLESPLKLLVPVTETCIREWLECDLSGFELYWRYRFAWRCILSTDLIPPYPNPIKDPISDEDNVPEFAGGNLIIFLANVLQVEKTKETHLRIARTLTFAGHFKEATAEYDSVIEIAQKQGSAEALKSIYLEQVLGMTDLRVMDTGENALQIIEKYMALDKSNGKVYACLGVARFQLGDYPGAIDAFRTALSLNEEEGVVAYALLETMFLARDYQGMMELIDIKSPATISI